MKSREAVYPVIIPNGWQLIDSQRNRIPLEPSLTERFQRLRAFGAVLAMAPSVDSGAPGDGVVLNMVKDRGPWNEDLLDEFSDWALAQQRYPDLKPRCEKQLLTVVFSRDLGAKIMLSHFDAFSGRLARLTLYYFFRNVDDFSWCLQYFVDADKYAWMPAVLERETEGDPRGRAIH